MSETRTPLENAALDVVNAVAAHSGSSFRGALQRSAKGIGPWTDADVTEDERNTARELQDALIKLVTLGRREP
jgi:hypothetical protein